VLNKYICWGDLNTWIWGRCLRYDQVWIAGSYGAAELREIPLSIGAFARILIQVKMQSQQCKCFSVVCDLHYSHKIALILFQLRSSIWPRSRFLCVPQPSVRLLARCLSSSPPARRTKASCRTEDNCEAETGEFVGMWRGWHCFLFCCGTGRGEDTVEAERGLIRVLSCAQQKMLSLTRDSQSSF